VKFRVPGYIELTLLFSVNKTT